ncbi:Na+/H+ antiporter NhaC family protein [Neisseria leonii]|uniref:Na+/H+ antiporter NhaC family protein n=1 Tax=Neisseria leonii TaxID=2995413 RepID=UPI00237A863D|nr:Na+/H+ antiporter NhaC family protein [Neisseria sp. 3986]MDD9326306.1 Na+/H+ antiporter NhaC [Neisseria sp. 3986]
MNGALIAMRPKEAFVIAAMIVAVMGITMIGFGWVPHLSIVLVMCGLFAYGRLRGLDFAAMQVKMADGVVSGIGAIYLFFYIGLLVAALMMSGAIPTLMYYGFELISPNYFYISAFVLCSVIGISLGSGFTTCATAGVAFLGMAEAFNAEPAIVAGAVVSGALFGDKMSPLSDTTTIAASVVGIDLFDHIRNMLYTTVPAWLLTALCLWLFGGQAGQGDLSGAAAMQQQLTDSGLVHGYALLPLALLVLLAVLKVNAVYTIIATITAAIAVTYLHSSPSLAQLGGWFFGGYKPAEGLDLGAVGRLVSRGGMESMFFSQTIVVLALSLGGLLGGLGVLPALLSGIGHLITGVGRATATAAATAFGINFLIGEQYLSLLLSGNAFKPLYARLGLHPRNLARTIEDAGTVINPLVPWGVYGVFLAGILQVPVVDYVPYAFFCYFSLLLTLIYGFTGFTISKVPPQNPQQTDNT